MSTGDSNVVEDNDNLCVVCFKDVEIYSIGSCDHAVCFECSTRMRVLCKQKECPICRRELPKVLFSKRVEPFAILYPRFEKSNLQDPRLGIVFSTLDIQKAYQKLLEHRCQICQENEHKWPFRTFQQLKDHKRREHELFYCDICTENLKIFSFERRCYSRPDLALHRRKGDKDNTSHRGHPLCEFCDIRLMDNDELFRHLRRNHLYCHLCDADGKYMYYDSMEDLKKHFLDEHFLCEEGDCKNVPLTAVYRTKIDLKAHITQEHSRFMSKSATKQARTLELEFNLRPRPDTRHKRPNRRDRQEEEVIATYNVEPGGPGGGPENQPQVFVNPLASDQFPALGGGTTEMRSVPLPTKNYPKFGSAAFKRDDFPTLGEPSNRQAPTVTITANSANNSTPEVTITRTVRNQQTLQKVKENFPALGSSSKPGSSTVRLSVNSNGPKKTPNVSIQVNQKPNGMITTHITTSAPSTSRASHAFPALGKPSVPVSQPQWVPAKPKKVEEIKSAKVAPCPVLETSDLNSFPKLSKGKTEKPKKTSSVTVPVSSWVNLNSMKRDKKNEVGTSNNNNTKSTVNSTNLESKLDEMKLVDDKNKEEAKKNKKKKNKTILENDDNREQNKVQVDMKEKETDKLTSLENKNGFAKQRSELKVGNLSNKDFPSLSSASPKPPPGFSNKTPQNAVKPPPGFDSSNFPSLGLTFTSSSGQRYSISPTNSENFRQPHNFQNRNQNLIKRFREVLNDTEAIKEFKLLSDAFRNGNYPAKDYHEHCRHTLGDKFDEIFPELLVLLPDIDKQLELFHLMEQNSKSQLVKCENCTQVIFKKELRDHYNYHRLDNHFPSLGTAQHIGNAWGK